MAKFSHFVVTYDHKTGKFALDDSTCEDLFTDGWMWDEEAQEWTFPSSEEDIATEDDAGAFLAKLLNGVEL